jgi:oxygen-dependent protoporphyrinogen oxidase
VAVERVVVIGGGISGLAAAWEITGGATPQPGAPAVTVLEASDRLGGPLRSGDVGERIVDLGPDGFLGRRPEAIDLCREAGMADALVPVGARGASVWARGRLRALPEGHALGIPTRFWPTARSGIVGLPSAWPAMPCCPDPTSAVRSATAPSDRWCRASSADG